MNLFEYARKPYPLNINRWSTILIISLFISFFLVIFQPFGLHNIESDWKVLLITGYGLVTLAVLILDTVIVPLIFPRFFNEEKWTVSKEFLLLVGIVITIGMGNYAYSVILTIVPWAGLQGFFIFTLFTLSIAIIPIIGVIVISHNRLLRQNLKASNQMNQMIGDKKPDGTKGINKLVITSDSKNQKLEIPASSLICIESQGNYVNTWFLEEGKVARLLIRNTIKEIEKQIADAENLFKCHRAFIINLALIENVRGNSQGYRLQMKYLDREIQVARNYSKSFRETLSRTS
jgi:hypothetical protein